MNQPYLYSKNNGFQCEDAMYALRKYFYLVQWKTSEEEKVIDVGCGDGTVTKNLLYPLLPENVQGLTGIDISLEMIEFAKAQFDDEKVSFMQLDIGTKQLDVDLKEGFHHIFSFYCIHWVEDQRQCAVNLYNMLKPGGDMFLVLAPTHPFFLAYENLSKRKIWAEYMKDFKKYVSPYQHSEDPAKEFTNTLSQVGFAVNLCEIINRSYIYKDILAWKASAEAVNPFLGRISDDLKPKFIDDMLSEMKKLNCTVLNNSNQETIHLQYKMCVVYAYKSL